MNVGNLCFLIQRWKTEQNNNNKNPQKLEVCLFLFSVLYDGQTFLQAGTEPSGFRHLLNSNVIQTQCSVRMSWKLVVCSLPSVMLLWFLHFYIKKNTYRRLSQTKPLYHIRKKRQNYEMENVMFVSQK